MPLPPQMSLGDYENKVREYMRQMGADPVTAEKVASQASTQAAQQQSSSNPLGSMAKDYLMKSVLGGSGGALVATPIAAPQLPSSLGSGAESLLNSYAPLAGGGTPASAAAAAPGPFSLSGIGGAGNAILPLAGAAGLADTVLNKRTGARGYGEGIASGIAAGSYFGPWGMLAGGVIGAGTALANTEFGGKTNKGQLARDRIREYLKGQGIVGSGYSVSLGDNSKYNIGVDGHAMLKNIGMNINNKSERHPYDIDFSNPLSGHAVANIDPLTAILSGGDKKLTSDFTGYFGNAALSNVKDEAAANKNILGFYQKAGLNKQSAFDAINQLQGVDDNLKNVYRNSLNNLFSGAAGYLNKATQSRSTTRSPGISKEGKRISYGKK